MLLVPVARVRFVSAAIAISFVLGLWTPIEAAPITYTLVMDNVSGFFDTSSFTNQQVTLTMSADTSTVTPYGPPGSPFGYSNSVTPGGAAAITVQVGSGAVTNVTSSLAISGVNQFSNNTLTFYLGSTISDPVGFYYVWDASYPGAQAVLTTDQSSTNAGFQARADFATNPLSLAGGGTFYVDATAAGQASSFTSATAVPEPSAVVSLALAGIAGGLWSIRRRNRAKTLLSRRQPHVPVEELTINTARACPTTCPTGSGREHL